MTEMLCVRKYIANAKPVEYRFGFQFEGAELSGKGKLTLYSYDPNAYTVGFWYELTLNHNPGNTTRKERE